jgi:flagellar L-ring protein precursor FlgH
MKLILMGLLAAGCVAAAAKKKNEAVMSPLDRYVTEAKAGAAAAPAPSPGAIWSPGARLADAARDPRASQVDDVLTILVVESASAVAKGSTQTERASSTANSVSAAGGLTRALGPWANLAGASGDTKLAGTGTTSRDLVISTTLTARVAGVMPSGALVVEAFKDVQVNSERQTITVRGGAWCGRPTLAPITLSGPTGWRSLSCA